MPEHIAPGTTVYFADPYSPAVQVGICVCHYRLERRRQDGGGTSHAIDVLYLDCMGRAETRKLFDDVDICFDFESARHRQIQKIGEDIKELGENLETVAGLPAIGISPELRRVANECGIHKPSTAPPKDDREIDLDD